MGKIKYILILVLGLSLLISIKQTTETAIKQSEFSNMRHYVSIDGLWQCTTDTEYQYPHGTLKYFIKIYGDAFGEITARGCFMWDDRFYDYWEFDTVRFIESTNELLLIDNEGGKYRGTIDIKKEEIRGFAFWEPENKNDSIKLNFQRAEEEDVNKLFFPITPGTEGSIAYTYYQPEQNDNYLNTGSIFNYITDSTSFYDVMGKIIKQKFGRLESLLIIKDQKLILEEYFYGYNKTQLHYINSCTKSITSLLLGILLEHHKKLNVDQSIFNYFPQYDTLLNAEKKKITLRHVLTMTSGIEEGEDFKGANPEEFIKYKLSLPLESNPGERFQYSNESTNLLGCLIYTLENKQADEFAKEVLFNKLGINNFIWDKENGILSCASGLYMYPRDMAKIGLLSLNDGCWNGEQIVSKEWIKISTKPHVTESEFFDYGFQWWHRSKQNKSWWDSPLHGSKNEHDMFLALGYGGQYIMVIKDLNMVIVITSSDNNESNGLAFTKIPMIIEEVVPLFK